MNYLWILSKSYCVWNQQFSSEKSKSHFAPLHPLVCMYIRDSVWYEYESCQLYINLTFSWSNREIYVQRTNNDTLHNIYSIRKHLNLQLWVSAIQFKILDGNAILFSVELKSEETNNAALKCVVAYDRAKLSAT